jgi:hypothetical protein
MQRFVMIPYDQFIKDKKDITKLKENIKTNNFTSDGTTAAAATATTAAAGSTITQSIQETEINKPTVKHGKEEDNVSNKHIEHDIIKQDKEENGNDKQVEINTNTDISLPKQVKQADITPSLPEKVIKRKRKGETINHVYKGKIWIES